MPVARPSCLLSYIPITFKASSHYTSSSHLKIILYTHVSIPHTGNDCILLLFSNEELRNDGRLSSCIAAPFAPSTEEQQWAAQPDLYSVRIYNSNW